MGIYSVHINHTNACVESNEWLKLCPMFSKRARGYDEAAVAPAKRFRRNATDLFLDNKLSGSRTQSLLNDAQAAGAGGLRDLAGSAPSHNSARDLRRKLKKWSKWPKTYRAEIRVKNPKTGEAGRIK